MNGLSREALRSEWVKTMRENSTDGHWDILPSEAAAIVARKFNVTAELVLLAFAPEVGFRDQC
ncbi:MAG TPA: hypothetical protein VNX86_04520 [Rhizomicrobium sp.]|jgi:hypothetical protein|nr:hypothetical protein [Rhizomicrobium sp.]